MFQKLTTPKAMAKDYVPDEYLFENGGWDIDGMNYLSQVVLTPEIEQLPKPRKSLLPIVLGVGLLAFVLTNKSGGKENEKSKSS